MLAVVSENQSRNVLKQQFSKCLLANTDVEYTCHQILRCYLAPCVETSLFPLNVFSFAVLYCGCNVSGNCTRILYASEA